MKKSRFRGVSVRGTGEGVEFVCGGCGRIQREPRELVLRTFMARLNAFRRQHEWICRPAAELADARAADARAADRSADARAGDAGAAEPDDAPRA